MTNGSHDVTAYLTAKTGMRVSNLNRLLGSNLFPYFIITFDLVLMRQSTPSSCALGKMNVFAGRNVGKLVELTPLTMPYPNSLCTTIRTRYRII